MMELLDFFNATVGTRLKLTEGKKTQIRARNKTFTIEEMKQAIRNRTVSLWHIEN